MQYQTHYSNISSLKHYLDDFKVTKKLPSPLLILAPLAGFSDLPFRKVVKDFGVDITVSEMISSHALVYENEKTLKMALKSPNETPFSLQISGSKEDILKRAVEKINTLDWVDIIDFNCGCPAPKVANNGNGSALLKDLDKFCALLKIIRASGNKQVYSVKVRLGYDKKIPLELADAINESGVDYCVVHARTKTDAYKKDRIDYDSLALMKEKLKIPMIANGEIDGLETFRRVIAHTNADGVMIGRAALKSPWIFWQIQTQSDLFPIALKKDLVLRHLDSMFEFYGVRGVIMFRKNLHAYAKGQKDSGKYRDFVNNESDYHVIRESIENFFGNQDIESSDIAPIFNKKSI